MMLTPEQKLNRLKFLQARSQTRRKQIEQNKIEYVPVVDGVLGVTQNREHKGFYIFSPYNGREKRRKDNPFDRGNHNRMPLNFDKD